MRNANKFHYSSRKKKVFSKVLFSSINTRWETPSKLYKLLDREFQFNFDADSSDGNGFFLGHLDNL